MNAMEQRIGAARGREGERRWRRGGKDGRSKAGKKGRGKRWREGGRGVVDGRTEYQCDPLHLNDNSCKIPLLLQLPASRLLQPVLPPSLPPFLPTRSITLASPSFPGPRPSSQSKARAREGRGVSCRSRVLPAADHLCYDPPFCSAPPSPLPTLSLSPPFLTASSDLSSI